MSKIKPKWYQEKALDDLKNKNSIGLFMGTGSGKTYTSLFKVKESPTKNLLIVCPSTITAQWEKSVKDVLPEYEVFDFKKSWTGKRRNEEILKVEGDNNVIIVGFGIFYRMENLMRVLDKSWHIIIDESHRIKDTTTKTSKFAHKISPKTNYKIILTATPTEQDKGGYIDLYSQLKFLGYMQITERQFKNRYCIEESINVPGVPFPIKNVVGYRETVEEIDGLLKKMSRSYTPTFTDDEPVHIEVNIERAKKYPKLRWQRFYEDLSLTNPTASRIAQKTMTTGVVMGRDLFDERLIYEDNNHKLEWLEEFLKDTKGKVLVYYQYNVEKDSLEALMKKLGKKYILINGDNNEKLDDIQNKDYDVILGQLDACSESIDGLQYKTNIAVYFALPESSRVYAQSLGRIDRIGQTLAPVYYYLIMDKTIDTNIWEMVQSKQEFNQETLNMIAIEEKEN